MKSTVTEGGVRHFTFYKDGCLSRKKQMSVLLMTHFSESKRKTQARKSGEKRENRKKKENRINNLFRCSCGYSFPALSPFTTVVLIVSICLNKKESSFWKVRLGFLCY